MILELPKSVMRGVQVSDKTKNGSLFKARAFLPRHFRFDLAEPTGIGFDAEPRWKSALRRLHTVSGALHVGNGVRRGSGRVRFPRGAFTGLLA
jgi:hypothetical protein